MGRYKIQDKKQQVAISVEGSKINAFGGKLALQKFLLKATDEMSEKLILLNTNELQKINKKSLK